MSANIERPKDNPPSDDPPGKREEADFYAPYGEFARNLRTWFIAYGVGAPALFIAQPELLSAVVASGSGRLLASLFLSGVAVQILVAIMYKGAMWYLYMGELDASVKAKKRYKVADWLSEAFWLELLFDLVTLVLFGVATALALEVIV